jgi:hypothetical protein
LLPSYRTYLKKVFIFFECLLLNSIAEPGIMQLQWQSHLRVRQIYIVLIKLRAARQYINYEYSNMRPNSYNKGARKKTF